MNRASIRSRPSCRVHTPGRLSKPRGRGLITGELSTKAGGDPVGAEGLVRRRTFESEPRQCPPPAPRNSLGSLEQSGDRNPQKETESEWSTSLFPSREMSPPRFCSYADGVHAGVGNIFWFPEKTWSGS